MQIEINVFSSKLYSEGYRSSLLVLKFLGSYLNNRYLNEWTSYIKHIPFNNF